jgi:hypothetical protein
MRRAAGGQAAQGNAALEALRRATRDLEGSRSTQVAEEIQRLDARAREMRERQRDVAEGVAALPHDAPEARAERLRRLGERKDGLAGDVERLEADADRLSRGGRRDQPEAARALAEAAEAIRESRLRDKIVFSKDVMRDGSSDYAGSFEGQIGRDLDAVAERLGAAAGALTGESATRRRERALEIARELVRGLESLRDRIDARQGRGAAPREPGDTAAAAGPAGEPGGRGAQGQPGQPGDSGRGEGSGRGDGQGQETGGRARPPSRVGGGDARQFTREFGMRRQEAQELRRDLARQEIDVSELDAAIADLQRLESARAFGDPRGLDQLQAAAIERLKTFEFMLYRRLGLGDGHRLAAGAPAQVPPEYRALVEEYYRSLGRREGPR